MNRYRIYPSLLDGYSYYQSLDSEELRAVKLKELMDSINRLPHEPYEAASRGTALNAIMDVILCREKPADGIILAKKNYTYEADIDGFHFSFDRSLVEELQKYIPNNSIPQAFCESEIRVQQGVVTLYGYADYVSIDSIVDLKSTTSYTPGKYRNNWQHHVYPYCLLKSGYMEECRQFTYTVAELNSCKDGIIRGNIITECYPFDFGAAEKRLYDYLSYEFIPFLESVRKQITDAKIFT